MLNFQGIFIKIREFETTWGARMKDPLKKKGPNGRRTKTSKRRAPKWAEGTDFILKISL